jgi:hypothetical protein
MRLKLLLFSLVFGLSWTVNAQPESALPAHGTTPFWLPRGALLGTYLQRGAIVPQARLQWQFTFFQDRKDALVVLVEGGGGWSVGRPDTVVEGKDEPMDAFFEHTLQFGPGYRNHSRSGFHWGFQVTGGPVWYGAHLRNLPDERYTVGLVEGRVHLGHQLGPAVLGVSIGYAEPFSFKRRSLAAPYVGGWLLGLFADWR